VLETPGAILEPPPRDLPSLRRARTRVGDRADLITITAPALLAAVACLVSLSTRSLWLDEGASISIASQHGHALWQGIEHDGGNMAAYYLLLHFVIAAFGHNLAVLRMPSVIANALTAGLVSALSLRLLGGPRRRWIALAGGVLTAISLPLVFWGQDVRGYALMVTAATGSWYALTVIFQTPRDTAPPRAAVSAYAITTLIALYIGFDVALLIPGQLVLLFAFRERARVVLGALAAVAVLCIPLFILATTRGSGQLFWVPGLTLHTIGPAAVTLASGGMPPNFHETLTSAATTVITLGLAVAALVLIVRRLRRGNVRGLGLRGLGQRVAEGDWPPVLLASWLFVPTLVALAGAALGTPVELSRTTILMMPALVLLVCWLLAQPGLPARALPLGVALLIVLRLLQLIPSYGTSPENWKATVNYVLSETPARPACVVFYPQDGREPFDYYVREEMATDGVAINDLTPTLPSTPWAVVKPFVEKYSAPSVGEITRIVRSCPSLWLIASHQGQPHPVASAVDLNRYNRLLTELSAAYSYSQFRQFGYAAVVHTALLSRAPLPNSQLQIDEATPGTTHTPLSAQVLAWNVPLGKGAASSRSPLRATA
jgi:hypothetical protein